MASQENTEPQQARIIHDLPNDDVTKNMTITKEQGIDTMMRCSQNEIDEMDENDEKALDKSAQQLIESTLAKAVKRLAMIDDVQNHDEPLNFEDTRTKTNLNESQNVTELNTKENVGPVEDPFEKATKFLEKHQLLMLFQVKLKVCN
jgi:hypothetical protein